MIAIDVFATKRDSDEEGRNNEPRKYLATRYESGNELGRAENEQWREFEAKHAEDVARIKMSVLKAHLKQDQLDRVLSRLTAHCGVNFLAVPYYRELLELTEFQEAQIEKIEPELKEFQNRVTDFKLEIEAELFSVLGDQQNRIEKIFTENSKVELVAPMGFEIPVGYESKYARATHPNDDRCD